MRYVFSSVLASLLVGSVATPAWANGVELPECTSVRLLSSTLIECANPNDSPGPFVPTEPLLQVADDKDAATAMLVDGHTVSVDVESGVTTYSVDGEEASAEDAKAAIDAALTTEEQASVSDVLATECSSPATAELSGLMQ